jgi:uncharacterized protein (DUF2225 family)
MRLKKQIKDQKKDLKEREAELEKMKHSVKYSKVQELEAEIKAYSDESIRLKIILEQSAKANQVRQVNPVAFTQYEDKLIMSQ